MIEQEERFDGFYGICTDLEGYIPTYSRGDLTNNLHGSAGFRTDTQIVSKQRMKSINVESKKSAKRLNTKLYSDKVA